MAYSGPILVTGAAGFIGSHLCDALLAEGRQVVAADRIAIADADNLASAKDSKAFSYMCGDLSDTDFADKCVARVSHVAHLAAMASVPASIKDPRACHADTLTSTLNLLTAARESVSSFVFASSAAVYGDTEQLPVSEDAPTNPLSPYAAAKLAGEQYLKSFAHAGLNALALRFFNVYGPRQDPSSPYSGVISIFAERLTKDQEVTIYGDGKQTRDFVYVGDVVRCVQYALRSGGSAGSIINVGKGSEISLLELMDTLKQVTGKQAVVQHKTERTGDIKRSFADVSNAEELLKFKAETTLIEGLRSLLN